MAIILRSASLWLKIATACVALGLLLFVIGFATNAWMVSSAHRIDSGNGLWNGYHCRGDSCKTQNLQNLNDYHRAIQAMECIGLIGFLLATIVLLLYMVADSCRRRDFLQATTGLIFGGLLFACIGFGLYGDSDSRKNYFGFAREVGWSMGVACAGAAAYGLAGIMLIIQLIR